MILKLPIEKKKSDYETLALLYLALVAWLEKKAFPIHSLSLTDSFVNENAKEALAAAAAAGKLIVCPPLVVRVNPARKWLLFNRTASATAVAVARLDSSSSSSSPIPFHSKASIQNPVILSDGRGARQPSLPPRDRCD